MTTHLSRKKPCEWEEGVSLASYSTYKIGGPAKLFTTITSLSEMVSAVTYCHQNQIRYYILGKGSNTLFDDRGFDGAVIFNKLRGFESEGDYFEVLSGTSFARFGVQCAKLGYGGIEYSIGIPGTVGGAIFMNAGASGQEISTVVESVDYIHADGRVKTYSKDEIIFKYRWSSFHEMDGVIYKAKLKLYPFEEARKQQLEMIEKRKSSQPYTEPSCGCVFRNGEGYSTGKLIDELGLKGFKIGGAQISPMHANFIVNIGGATAEDVKRLVEMIEKIVFEKKKISLKREIRFVPFERENNAF